MTSNSCCNLPNGQHRCHDKSCGRVSRIYDSLDILVEHIVLRKHDDFVHQLHSVSAQRDARKGVASAVDAEKQRGGDISNAIGGDALDVLDADRQERT